MAAASRTITNDSQLVDYAKSLDCIHCGLCIQSCPTYKLTSVEASSPRGRIHLMRAVAEERIEADADFADEMQFCLLCRHCESVCPAGVNFGAMMEHTRGALRESHPLSARERFQRWLGFGLVLPRRWAVELAAMGLRRSQGARWMGDTHVPIAAGFIIGEALTSLTVVHIQHAAG